MATDGHLRPSGEMARNREVACETIVDTMTRVVEGILIHGKRFEIGRNSIEE